MSELTRHEKILKEKALNEAYSFDGRVYETDESVYGRVYGIDLEKAIIDEAGVEFEYNYNNKKGDVLVKFIKNANDDYTHPFDIEELEEELKDEYVNLEDAPEYVEKEDDEELRDEVKENLESELDSLVNKIHSMMKCQQDDVQNDLIWYTNDNKMCHKRQVERVVFYFVGEFKNRVKNKIEEMFEDE